MNESPANIADNPKATIDWFRSTPWWRLAGQSVTQSWRASHVLLCALGLLLTQAWTSLAHYLFNSDTEQAYYWLTPVASPNPIAPNWSTLMPPGVIGVWQQFLMPPVRWLQNPTLNGSADTLASMIGIIAIWTWIGGCLTRRSVMEMGLSLTASWSETFKLVTQRWQSLAWSVTMPSALIFMIGLGPLVLGWLSNIPGIGMWIAGALLVPTLLCILGIGWCAGITLFGYPLSVCSIMTERQADAYDGISRSAAYTFQRPLTLGLCLMAGQLLLTIGGSMFAIVVSVGYSVVEAGFDIGSFSSIRQMDSMWHSVVNGIGPLLINAYGYSFFWSFTAGTYLILRKDVDHAEFDLIDMAVPSEPEPLKELPQKSDATSPELTENTAE